MYYKFISLDSFLPSFIKTRSKYRYDMFYICITDCAKIFVTHAAVLLLAGNTFRWLNRRKFEPKFRFGQLLSQSGSNIMRLC